MNINQLSVALYTIVYKEVRRFMRIWPQTLLPPAITMSLYFVIFGNLIGSRIGDMGGYSYMEFIVPGLIMMAVITNSYANVSSSFFSSLATSISGSPIITASSLIAIRLFFSIMAKILSLIFVLPF